MCNHCLIHTEQSVQLQLHNKNGQHLLVYILLFIYFFSDNVHFQQAAQISKALVDEQVDFESMVSKKGAFHENFQGRLFYGKQC